MSVSTGMDEGSAEIVGANFCRPISKCMDARIQDATGMLLQIRSLFLIIYAFGQ